MAQNPRVEPDTIRIETAGAMVVLTGPDFPGIRLSARQAARISDALLYAAVQAEGSVAWRR